MRPIEMTDHAAPGIERFPVSVVLERRPATQQSWVDHLWSAVGVVAGHPEAEEQAALEPVYTDEQGVSRFLVGGMELHLHPDECESYYHNMMSPTPRCYVVARMDDEDEERRPDPFLVSMSFDEAHAYLEGEDEIYAVDIPPEIYRWTESFVLAYYAPEKKRKRKLTDWRNDSTRNGGMNS